MQSGYLNAPPLAGGQVARGGATRVSGPSKNEWFDPGANKKNRNVRPTKAPFSLAKVPDVKPPKRSQSNKIEGSRKSPPKSTAPAQNISTTTVTENKNHRTRLSQWFVQMETRPRSIPRQRPLLLQRRTTSAHRRFVHWTKYFVVILRSLQQLQQPNRGLIRCYFRRH